MLRPLAIWPGARYTIRMKSLLRSGPVSALLGWLIWAYMTLVTRTMRWTIEGDASAKDVWTEANGVIVAGWHSRILLLPSGWTKRMRKWPGRRAPSAMLISLSSDAEPVARAIRHLGLEAIRGSSNHKRKRKDKGGVKAVAEAIRRLKSGGAVCITPDGPRGPMQRAQAGPALLAQRSGAPIIPYALAASPSKRLKTWDRFIIPFPFTKGAIVFGEPIFADRSSDTNAIRTLLETRLNEATARAEKLVGADILSPAAEGLERRASLEQLNKG